MALVVNPIRRIEALTAIVPEWASLQGGLSPFLPFTSPDWHLAWWRHLRRRSLTIRDRLHAYAIRDADGALVAVAPMMVARVPGYGPSILRELQFLGADGNVTEWRGIVCRRERLVEVVAALAQTLASEAGDFDRVQWAGLPIDDRCDWSTVIPGFVASRTLDWHVLNLPGSWEQLHGRLSRNLRESLRKCRNSLKRDGLEPTFGIVTDAQAIGPALARLMSLHLARAAAPGLKPHGDVFSDPSVRAFIADVARGDGACVFELRIGGTVVASRMGFRTRRELYLYYSGFEPRWAGYSVMTTLVERIVRWAIDNGMDIVNLSMGTDVSKTRWRPARIGFLEGHQQTGSALSTAAFRLGDRFRNRLHTG